MIDITLRFATLELAITALAAVRQATGTESAGNAPQPDKATPVKTDAKSKKDAETKPSAAAAQTAASPIPPAASPSPGTSSGAATVTREAVSAAVKAGAATNRAAVVAVLEKFGAKAAKDLKDEQLGAFSEALAEALKPAEDLG